MMNATLVIDVLFNENHGFEVSPDKHWNVSCCMCMYVHCNSWYYVFLVQAFLVKVPTTNL